MTRKRNDARARRAWQGLFALLIRSAPLRTASLSRRGLTPNDSRGLFSLNPVRGRSMRSLADEWQCDPSNATFIIDRLEALGLVSRRPLPTDKRVKLVVLTRKGQRTRAELLEELHQPPPEFDRLRRADLDMLESVLAKLTDAGPGTAATRNRPTAARTR
jgi:DNA-binding MarR family transcriptional regulator